MIVSQLGRRSKARRAGISGVLEVWRTGISLGPLNRSPITEEPNGRNGVEKRTVGWQPDATGMLDAGLFFRFLSATSTHRYALTTNLFPADAPFDDFGIVARRFHRGLAP
jgi:hypothetical protein